VVGAKLAQGAFVDGRAALIEGSMRGTPTPKSPMVGICAALAEHRQHLDDLMAEIDSISFARRPQVVTSGPHSLSCWVELLRAGNQRLGELAATLERHCGP
jgi:hypothetical protein